MTFARTSVLSVLCFMDVPVFLYSGISSLCIDVFHTMCVIVYGNKDVLLLLLLYHAQVGSRLRYAIIHWGSGDGVRVVKVDAVYPNIPELAKKQCLV